MAQILGITTSADSETYWSENARRMVFHQYPQGAAPLTGLLSLMGDQEVDKSKFGYWEDRMDPHKSTTSDASGASGGPFDDGAGADETDPFTTAAGSTLRVYVADYTQFRNRDVVWVRNALNSSGAAQQIKGVVTAEPSASGHITIRLVETATAIANDSTNIGLDVFVIGSATGEGSRSKTGGHSRPIEIENYTQIQRTAFSLTRTALKGGLRYDSEGEHREKAKKNGLRHSIMIENSMLWGVRRTDTVTNEDSESVPEKKMGGLEWFLRQWELGNTGNGGAFDYRPGGTDITSTAWDASDDKRILDINGTITTSQWNDLMERLFRYTNAENFQKLCLCGGGFLNKFNQMIDNTSVVNRKLFDNGKAGFSFKEWESPNGIVMFKTHPLFTQHAAFNNSAWFLDMGNLKYTYLADSDTELLENRQANDADKRKDEWLTECSLEVRFPESHMFINNLTGIVS